MALAFFATALTGGRRFAHVERLRSDEVIRTILGVKRLRSAMTQSRYFGAFVRSQIKHPAAVLGEFTWARLSAPPLRALRPPLATIQPSTRTRCSSSDSQRANFSSSSSSSSASRLRSPRSRSPPSR